jgi:phosphate starvation-inducible membrane PsiE
MEKRLKLKIVNNKAWIKFDITMLIVNLIGVMFQPKYNILAWNVGVLIVVIGLRVCEIYVEKRNGFIDEDED